jgi:pimeloyl-ACP methyl ester carboxylesterase
MPTLRLSPELEMNYVVDDYTDPWRKPETVLMLHGNAESSASWYAWVPTLARHYRVVRPDMRGFGGSSPMPADFRWTLDVIIDDYCRLMDELKIERFHLIAAKIGGTIARAFAERRPARVRTLTVVGTPAPFREGVEATVPATREEMRKQGVEHWARKNMARRLGGHFPPEGVEWWSKFMGRTALSTQLGFMGTIAVADIRPDLPRIACPTLVATTEDSALGTVDETRAWQKTIADSELLVLPGNSYHVAATHAEACARAALEFIQRRAPAA